jgi:hypothetical protein
LETVPAGDPILAGGRHRRPQLPRRPPRLPATPPGCRHALGTKMHKTAVLCIFVHRKFQRVAGGPKSGVNFRLCGNQARKLCQNHPLWEVSVTAALVLPKPPVRITAGEGHHTDGTGDALPWEACIHCQIYPLWEALHFPQRRLLTKVASLIPTKGIFDTTGRRTTGQAGRNRQAGRRAALPPPRSHLPAPCA